MITAGLTGGIGSGKSTVAREFENLGATVVYADDLAKELMQTDSSLKKKLSATFGEQTYHSDGSLNKPHLINQAFNNNRVDELNAIVHPAIRDESKRLIKKAGARGDNLFVYEAAVLLNQGRPDYLDKVILVTADKELRIKRVMERDGVSRKEVVARMDKQPDFDALRNLADIVIENNRSKRELILRTRELFNSLIGNP